MDSRIDVPKRGCCHGCGILGPPGRMRNFLCADCADPQKIIHVCARCHYRIELAPESETIAALRTYLAHIPDRPGITVVVDTCDRCREPGEIPGGTRFYALRPSEYH